jgi:hypothetical protein
VIVAVVTVWVMQAPVDDEVDVVAMRDRLVPAAGPVHMATLVAGSYVMLTLVGVGVAYLDGVLVVVHLAVHLVAMVQVAVVQIVQMVAVANGLVAASRAVLVDVVRMDLAVLGHWARSSKRIIAGT